MSKIKKFGMAAGTFSVALGIGFVMQNGDALASRFGADDAAERPARFTVSDRVQSQVEPDDAELVIAQAAEAAPEEFISKDEPVEPVLVAQVGVLSPAITEPDVPEPTVTLASDAPESTKAPVQQTAPEQLSSVEPEALPEIELPVEPDIIQVSSVDCVPVMTATPGAAAIVAVSVNAPCHISAPFTVHHQGMMFTAMTDEAGKAAIDVPALAEVAVMIAAFADGDGAVATAKVADFAQYDRAVLQWQGDTTVAISAYEDGAEFGENNHIHAGNPGDLARLMAAEGGYLVRLGDDTAADSLMAEIYTFPTDGVEGATNVLLVAEVEITAGNCGQELNAQSLQVAPTGATSALDLTMIMPECDAVGDFLILQNMFEDLTLASR